MEETEFEPLRGPVYPEDPDAQARAIADDPQIRDYTAARAALANDPHRPTFHFSPPGGHMNDPNGLCLWQGRWHMFYQRKPQDVPRVHWAHAVSDDLIHWRDLPLALYPDTEKDCYSGQTLVEPDRVIAVYHGTRSGNAIATASDPFLLNWSKHPRNPVMPMPPPREDGRPYRTFDPCIWKEPDGYYALSGSYWDGGNVIDCTAVEHLFRSPDLSEWEYLGPLFEDGFFTEPGEDGAVPNFWPIGNGKHLLLLFSHKRAARYYVGEYDANNHRFHPDDHARMNHGFAGSGSLHAPSAAPGKDGEVVALFNITEGKTPAGWNGMISLPRILSLNADNSLRIEPWPEVESLRADHGSVEARDIEANEEMVLDGIGGKAIEIEAVIDPGTAREAGLYVLRAPDASERTRISFFNDPPRKHCRSALHIDVCEASTRADVLPRPPETGPLVLNDDEPLRLRIFVDRSVVEVFANGRQCLTLRAYPERADSDGVSLFARGGRARLLSLDAWSMQSIWPELQADK